MSAAANASSVMKTGAGDDVSWPAETPARIATPHATKAKTARDRSRNANGTNAAATSSGASGNPPG